MVLGHLHPDDAGTFKLAELPLSGALTHSRFPRHPPNRRVDARPILVGVTGQHGKDEFLDAVEIDIAKDFVNKSEAHS